MTLTSDNVRVAVTGAVYMGPTTATAPTGPTSSLGGDWDDLGYMNEDGVTEARSRDTTDIKGHDGTVVRTVITEAKATFKFTCIETNEATINLYYGAEVVGGAFDVKPAETGGRRSFVIDTIDGDEVERTYIPDGELSEVEDRSRKNSDAIGYGVTIVAYPSDTLDGAAFRTWMTAFGS